MSTLTAVFILALLDLTVAWPYPFPDFQPETQDQGDSWFVNEDQDQGQVVQQDGFEGTDQYPTAVTEDKATDEQSEDGVEIQIHYQNNWDSDLHVECHKGSAIYKFQSIHNNKREDRLWRFDCKTFGGYTPASSLTCNWHYGINSYDAPMHFVCPANQYMAGVRSRHHNRREDRVWDALCCHRANYCTQHCRTTAYVNQMDRPLHYTSRGVFTGLISYHDNHTEDRRWKVVECAIQPCKSQNNC